MLYITIPETKLFDEDNSCFIFVKPTKLQMEHSLVSVAKWEAKWKKSFIYEKEKTSEEWLDYFKCMTITQNVDPNVYLCFSSEDYQRICDYIADPMTATIFKDDENKSGGYKNRKVTSEEIYFEMFQYNVPMECQKWHLNRLLALLRVCSIKMKAPSKDTRSKHQRAMDYAKMNAERKARLGLKG